MRFRLTPSHGPAIACLARTLALAFSTILGLLPSLRGQTAPPEWIEIDRKPTGSLVHDLGRDRLTAFAWDPFGEIHILDHHGGDWVDAPVEPGPSPAGVVDVCAIYDVVRNLTVVLVNTQAAIETWEWKGGRWIPRQGLHGLQAHSMAATYDIARQRVVLVASNWSHPPGMTETWDWDGSIWRRRASEGAALDLALTYDVARQVVVAFGADVMSSAGVLREWDGAQWQARIVANAPCARTDSQLCYDVGRRRAVLCGGRETAAGTPLHDTWEWDGTAWVQLAFVGGWMTSTVFDLQRGRVLGFAPDGDLLAWDGSQWTVVTPRPGLPEFRWSGYLGGGLERPVVAYDRSLGATLTLGLTLKSPLVGEAWTLSGPRWHPAPPTPQLPPLGSHAIAYDGRRQRMVLFAGFSASLDSTYELYRGVWHPIRSSRAPRVTWGYAMTFDAARGAVILFGGGYYFGSSFVLANETWRWDGSTWTQLSPRTSPSPRLGPSLAYDSVRRELVLFGGVTGSAASDETWIWNGVDWSLASPAHRPSPSAWHASTFDPLRKRTILYGGSSMSNPLFPANDAWEWDGHDWHSIGTSPKDSMLGVSGIMQAMAFDETRERVVMIDNVGRTWIYGGRAASSLPLGTACPGSHGSPTLISSAPRIGSTHLTLELHSVRPASPSLFLLALATRAQPLASCQIYLDGPLTATGAVTNVNGFAASPGLAIPNSSDVRGVALFAQAVVLDPLGAAGGLALSNGRTIVIGD